MKHSTYAGLQGYANGQTEAIAIQNEEEEGLNKSLAPLAFLYSTRSSGFTFISSYLFTVSSKPICFLFVLIRSLGLGPITVTSHWWCVQHPLPDAIVLASVRLIPPSQGLLPRRLLSTQCDVLLGCPSPAHAHHWYIIRGFIVWTV